VTLLCVSPYLCEKVSQLTQASVSLGKVIVKSQIFVEIPKLMEFIALHFLYG